MEDSQIFARPGSSSDAAAVGAIAVLFLLVFLGGVRVGCIMAGRDRRLREAGREAPKPITEAVKRIADSAIRNKFGVDLPHLPPDWQKDIYEAAFGEYPMHGAKMTLIVETKMGRAAKDAYRSLVASQSAMTQESE